MANQSEVEDFFTAFRMNLPVSELQYLAKKGVETPVSGDALQAYK